MSIVKSPEIHVIRTVILDTRNWWYSNTTA